MFAHIKVFRPKSDRLSARKKKNVLFLSCPQDYELKSQVLCEFEKKSFKKNFEVAKNLRV